MKLMYCITVFFSFYLYINAAMESNNLDVYDSIARAGEVKAIIEQELAQAIELFKLFGLEQKFNELIVLIEKPTIDVKYDTKKLAKGDELELLKDIKNIMVSAQLLLAGEEKLHMLVAMVKTASIKESLETPESLTVKLRQINDHIRALQERYQDFFNIEDIRLNLARTIIDRAIKAP